LAGPLIVATAAIGHAIAGRWDAHRRRRLTVFARVFLLSCLAPLANPYGWELYRHVFGLLLDSDVTRLIDEYQPSPFGRFQAMVLEWLVLAFVAVPSFSRQRVDRYHATHIVVWLHLALGAVRQAPLFALAAAPGLARLLDGLFSPPVDPESDGRLGRWSAWPVLASLAMAISVCAGVTWGKFDPKHWPLQAVPVLDQQPVGARLFHDQDWGGLIESECRPRRRTFLDDRFELFGKQALLDYIAALQGGPGWDELDARHHFDLVWVRPKCGLARRLDGDRGWEVLHRDEVSVLFRRKAHIGV